ncbi:esterase family protein [Rhodococcus sp. ARC_M6]|uniref:alpha/beta hydrolase n=1 Tax=Rhodococcus sp. ARC_M6 TaxID=2928852 RepID=UPI001FB210CE|nr:alpha/beta hydrolase-fold protein [Rhodococcus sp. ARC_M6]MCJ0901995.1 alpha/beta hydrolase-fold protein [Rhodococcus sp. ARC_M6]
MDWLYQTSVISGPLPVILTALGVLGGLWLLSGKTRWFYRYAIPVCGFVALLIMVAAWILVEKVVVPFPDPIAMSIYVWIGMGVYALLLLGPRIKAGGSIRSAAASVVAALLVVLAAATQINLEFSAYPTIGIVLGHDDFDRIALIDVPGPTTPVITGNPTDTVWKAPEGMTTRGRVATLPVPGTVSGFVARDAEVYLPPSYFTDPRPLLPVLVLMAGQPGSPQDWLQGGKLTATMDSFAHQHDGLAPIVVLADATGTQFANPLCTDSPAGNVATYLAKDLPAAVTAAFQVDTNPKAWAIGGLSYGGTCSLQMATNFPDVYPTFFDLSGQLEPSLGDRARTVEQIFGGNEGAFKKVNPMDILAGRKFPDSGGIVVVGSDDNEFKPGQQKIYDAAKVAGMDVKYLELPGGHSFVVWSAALQKELTWLSQRMGLIS